MSVLFGMRKLYLFITFLMIFITLQAQNISVLPGDFYRDSKDLTARTQAVKNDNNKNCALLKIITTEKGFTFEPDALGICKEVEYKTSEIWVWLAPGSRRITIKHPQLGQLRDYMYPEAIEASTVYVMKLTTAKISTVVEEVNTSNYVALTVNPVEASVKIDGEIVAVEKGQFFRMYPMGKHKYEVYADMYYPQEGLFDITDNGTTNLSVDLKPNFGFMEIHSSPETGAQVYVNGKKEGVTPYKSDKMASGTYKVELIRDMFKNTSQQVAVNDNKTTEVTIEMLPNFAEPVFVCLDEESEIWVDGEKKGKKSWSGRLSAGIHRVETKKDKHRTAAKEITLATGNTETFTIPSPVPIFGKLDVSSTPFGATVWLDGKEEGKTPMVIKKVLIGSHSLEIIKDKYAPLRKTISIEEGKTMKITETLHLGPFLEVEGNSTTYTKEINASASEMSFHITTDGTSISLKDLPSWLVKKSVSTTKVELFSLENRTVFPRECSFKIVADDLSEVIVVVKQKAAEPYLKIDNRSGEILFEELTESAFCKNYEVSTNFEIVRVKSNAAWCKTTYSNSKLYVFIKKNPYTHKRTCAVSVKASTPVFDETKRCLFTFSQKGKKPWLLKAEDDFSSHFINPRVGYDINNRDVLVGINYAWVPAHIGLNVSCMFGVQKDRFRKPIGTYTATLGPVFRLTSDVNVLDFQIFGGLGIIGHDWKPNMNFAGEVGLRFAWNTGYDFSPWDFTLGCFFAKNDIVPTLGIGAGIGPLACFFGNDPWYLRKEYDFACHFVNITYGYDVCSGDVLVGADYTWIQTHLGIRGAFSIGVLDLSYTAFAGPAIRLTDGVLDLQLYGGMGVFGADGVQFGGDVGLKFGWYSSRDFSLWDFELGCAFAEGHIVPTLGLSTVIGGPLALVISACLIPLGF